MSRVKSNAVAYAPAEPPKGKRKRGRPRRYGKKIKLKSLLSDPQSMLELASPVYGERNVTLRYRVCDLIWRPAGRLVRFVAVIHPTRGACLLMCTDISLSAVDIIHLYGLRFKIEHSFKQAIRLIGAFAYHFWMKDMTPLRYRNGNQYLHRKSRPTTATHVRRKMHAYHVFIRPASSPRACSSISRSLLPSWFGISSDPGCEPFVPASRRRNSSLPTRCASTSRFSPGFRKKRFPREIHRRSPRHNNHARISPRLMRKTSTLELVLERMKKVKAFRAKSKRKSTLAIANYPDKYNVEVIPDRPFLCIPEVSSERREYVPIGWLTPPTIPSNLVRVLIDADLWHFGVLTSRMHMSWLRYIGGRLKSDYRYSIGVVYNTFPWPQATDTQKKHIRQLAQDVLDARALFPDVTLADQYDITVMKPELRRAHRALDTAVDSLYRSARFNGDRERVEHLFALYERLISPLIAPPKRPRAKARR